MKGRNFRLHRLGKGRLRALYFTAAILQIGPVCAQPAPQQGSSPTKPATQDSRELPVRRVGRFGPSAEAYFSPEGKSLICNAKLENDDAYHVYTLRLDGSGVRRINDRGEDACSFFFPNGKKLIWTSTRDWPDLPKGNYSDPNDYPQGAEIYTSDLKGGNLQRLTNNKYYDAEVTISPNSKWVLFSRQIDGKVDLWRMRPDGSQPFQITHTPDWQEGGANFMPDNETIIYRAWKIEDQKLRGMPMTIFTIKYDGTGLKQITTDPGTNWAPFPHPDGKHFAYVKVLPPRNFEIFMMNLETKEQTRLTYSDAFDGFPAFSPDGKTMSFSSGREAAPGERTLHQYLMDVSSLFAKKK